MLNFFISVIFVCRLRLFSLFQVNLSKQWKLLLSTHLQWKWEKRNVRKIQWHGVEKLHSERVKAVSSNQNIYHTLEHAAVCRLRDGVDVWRHFMPFLPSVHLNDVLRINGQVLVGVNNHTEETRVCLKYKQTNKQTDNHWKLETEPAQLKPMYRN